MRPYIALIRQRMIALMQFRVAFFSKITVHIFWGYVRAAIIMAYYVYGDGSARIDLTQAIAMIWLMQAAQTLLLDRILLRPRSTIVQTISLRFQLTRLSRVVGMGALVIWCLRGQAVHMGLREGWLLFSALAGGMLIYMGVFVLTSALSFVTIETVDLSYIFTNGSYQAAKVPPRLLPDWIRRMLTYIVPMFVFCYYPAAAICGWGEPGYLGYLALPVGVVFVGMSLLVWAVGVRHYKSTGS